MGPSGSARFWRGPAPGKTQGTYPAPGPSATPIVVPLHQASPLNLQYQPFLLLPSSRESVKKTRHCCTGSLHFKCTRTTASAAFPPIARALRTFLPPVARSLVLPSSRHGPLSAKYSVPDRHSRQALCQKPTRPSLRNPNLDSSFQILGSSFRKISVRCV